MSNRQTNAELLMRPHDPRYYGEGTEKAQEVALNTLGTFYKGKVIGADMVGDGFELTIGVELTGRVYELKLDNDLNVLIKEQRPDVCPFWVERDIRRAKRNF